jgi:hypothetical protein
MFAIVHRTCKGFMLIYLVNVDMYVDVHPSMHYA